MNNYLKLNKRSVIRIKQRKDKTGTFKNQPKSGCPRLITDCIERNVVRLITTGECTNAVAIQKKLRTDDQIDVSECTIKRTLHRNGLGARVKCKKPYLKKMHRIASFCHCEHEPLGCARPILTGKTRDLNKHMNLLGNLRKGQCQPALRLMQNPAPPPVGNPTPDPVPPPAPESDLISFNENPLTHQPTQPREATAPAPDPEIRSTTERNKAILIYKIIANGIEFYDGKRKWYGVKDDFHALYNKYYFIKADNGETIIKAYIRIIDESEAISKKTKGNIDMRKTGNYTLTTIKLFNETTLAPKRSEKISEQEKAWINLATTGALIFAEKYDGEGSQYDVNSMYIFEMIKKDASWPIASGKFHTINSSFTEKWSKFPYGIYKATIEGNPPKKSLQCTRYLRYNPYGIYTHYDLECAKKNANGIEFYDGKRKWYGVKDDFHALYNKYYFIKADNGETIIKAYIRIIDESEAISKKTKGNIDMRKTGNYTLTTIKLFNETTLAPKRSEKISEQEKAWINLATTGALIFAEKYDGEGSQYDVNSMYIFEMIKKDASWPIASGKFHTINSSFTEKWSKFPYGIYKATIEGNPPKKSLQCTRYLRYNPYGIYTHYDLECAKKNGLKVYLMNESPNALIYEKNTRITGKDMFGEWGNILYNIKKEGGTAGKVSKALLVSLWGALCEQRNGQNYGTHPRIKPFLLVSTRKTISEIVKPLGDQVKRIHTDGFIVAGKVKLKTGIEMGELKFEKRGVCVVKNCISVSWKPSYPEIPNLITNSLLRSNEVSPLPDFGKIQDKEQNTKLTVKRKPLKRFDINLPNEIIIEILQHLRTQNDRLDTKCPASQCDNNELLFPVLYVNKRWNECATYLIWRRITIYRYNIMKFVELIKKKLIANTIKYIKQIDTEDIVSICQDIITISFKDCGWEFLNNSSLKMTLDTCKNLNNIIIYGSNRIAPKTVLSIPERCTTIKTIKIQNCERISDKIIYQLVYKYPKIGINKDQPIVDCFSTNETEADQAIEDIFYEV
ncbi:hypothetical protein Glove_63g120 [Diversispora epigaea]|uniref:F-box domain-containing protein n=1 Tax=Diversispora epigaea TaxID=1348612 RepID=A0A397JC41_9GLOM|nr:hypothetical protein Glove_63g120 [Diversispora epigaea]